MRNTDEGPRSQPKDQPQRVDNSDLIGSMPEVEIRGDILSTGIEWDAERP